MTRSNATPPCSGEIIEGLNHVFGSKKTLKLAPNLELNIPLSPFKKRVNPSIPPSASQPIHPCGVADPSDTFRSCDRRSMLF